MTKDEMNKEEMDLLKEYEQGKHSKKDYYNLLRQMRQRHAQEVVESWDYNGSYGGTTD